jgi:hypothetical protein
MKFIKRYLQNIIREAILNSPRAPLIVEIKAKDLDMKHIDINIRECNLAASDTQSALMINHVKIAD